MNLFYLKNKVVFYLASRYVTYAVQFVTSLVIAVELGPYYMGIWGFVMLLLNYCDKLNFGIAYSFNILYIQHREDNRECNNYIGNSIVLYGYLAAIIIALFVAYLIWGVEGFEKYNGHRYMLWICIIAILQYYSSFIVYLFRVKNLLNQVTFCQSIVVLLNFICVFIFRGETLIIALMAGYVIGDLLAIILAFTSGVIPSFKSISINRMYQGKILKKGFLLFLYNSCFYFIIISIRTIISGYYPVEDFGVFTFSFSLAHAILLLLEALSFVIFPKIISKLSSPDADEVRDVIGFYREIYITSAHFLVYLSLPLFPILVFFFPKYEGAVTTLNLIALSIIVNINSCGYADLLMARNKERILMKLSFGALILNCVIAMVFVKQFQVGFSYVIIATLITYIVYSFSVMAYGEINLGRKNMCGFMSSYFPLRLAVPYLSALIISLFQFKGLCVIIPLVFFLILNKRTIGLIKETVIKVLSRPEVVNL